MRSFMVLPETGKSCSVFVSCLRVKLRESSLYMAFAPDPCSPPPPPPPPRARGPVYVASVLHVAVCLAVYVHVAVYMHVVVPLAVYMHVAMCLAVYMHVAMCLAVYMHVAMCLAYTPCVSRVRRSRRLR